MDTNGKDTKGNSIEKESKTGPVIKCYKCQGYRHIAAKCLNPVKIIFVNGVPVAESESNLNEFIYQGKEEDCRLTNRSQVMTLVALD